MKRSSGVVIEFPGLTGSALRKCLSKVEYVTGDDGDTTYFLPGYKITRLGTARNLRRKYGKAHVNYYSIHNIGVVEAAGAFYGEVDGVRGYYVVVDGALKLFANTDGVPV